VNIFFPPFLFLPHTYNRHERNFRNSLAFQRYLTLRHVSTRSRV
jgi:hypothetical protein